MQFSDTTNNTGIVQQTRDMARVDATQWATSKVVNSCNNWLDRIFTLGKKKDRNFQLDDSNHDKLPIGSTDLIENQSDYSFLTDEDGNRITNITRIDILDPQGKSIRLKKIDQDQITQGLESYKSVAGTPEEYDLIADNIVRLYPKPNYNMRLVEEEVAGITYHFQRAPSYFVATDTTKEPGVPNDLHRGFVIAGAYDCALTLGLPNLQPLSIELTKEEQKILDYFASRNTDSKGRLSANKENNR